MGIAPSIEGPGILPSPAGALIVPALEGESPRPLLSVVVPTFNEIENLCEFLTAVRSTLDAALPGDYEVIVVDDDSPDRTWEAAAGMIVETDGFPAAPYDSVLVQLEGRLVKEIPGADQDLLLFQDGKSIFTARLPGSEQNRRELSTGSLMSITGVCAANADETHEARSFELLLRSPADLVVREKAT